MDNPTPARPIRVLLADDHPILRQGLVGLIGGEPDMVIVGEAADGEEALAVAREVQPDVVIMDINMPRLDGIEATRQLVDEFPDICVIGLSMHTPEDMAARLRQAGAVAYVNKSSSPDDLLDTIRACAGEKE